MIPPSGNTTFDVVFLGREEGPVENTLYIHTSAGSFRFVVRAEGTPNPYRLKPLVGVRMPVNSSYSPLIQMHNPHSEPIQVRKKSLALIFGALEQVDKHSQHNNIMYATNKVGCVVWLSIEAKVQIGNCHGPHLDLNTACMACSPFFFVRRSTDSSDM